MKKILLIFILFQMFSCDQSQTTEYKGYLEYISDTKPAYDPNGYVNAAFGYSVPVIQKLRLVETVASNSLVFVDAATESKSDLLMIIPFTETIEEMAQNLRSAGTAFRYVEGGITYSLSIPGEANISGSFAVSPYEKGGIGILRIITGDAYIKENTLTDLFKGLRFYPPQASLSERYNFLLADIEKQKQSKEDERWLGYFRDQMGVSPF